MSHVRGGGRCEEATKEHADLADRGPNGETLGARGEVCTRGWRVCGEGGKGRAFDPWFDLAALAAEAVIWRERAMNDLRAFMLRTAVLRTLMLRTLVLRTLVLRTAVLPPSHPL